MDLTLPHMPCAVRSSTTIFLSQSRSLCLLSNIRSPFALSPSHRSSSSLRSPLFRDRILINAASLMQPLFRKPGNPNPRLQMSARKPAEDVTRADSAHPETSTTKLLFQSSSRVDKGRLSERQSSPKREQFSRGPKIFHGRSDPRSDSKTSYTSRAPNHLPALGNGRRAGSTLDKEAQYGRISSEQRGSNLAQSRMSGTIPGPSSCARGEPSQSQDRIYVIQGLKQQVEQKDSRAKMQVTIEEPQKQRRRKGDGPTPEKQIRWELGMCSRYADLPRALSVFDRVTNEGVIKLTPHDYNVLLYICSSAAMGVLKPTGQGGVSESAQSVGLSTSEQTGKLMENPMSTTQLQAHEECRSSDAVENGVSSEDRAASSGDQEFVVTKELMDLGLKRGFEIYEHMLKEGVTVNEATFTSVARLAVAKGDGDLAFDMVKKMAATNITPRLRSYVPALSIYCKNKQVHQAFEVYAHMLVAGILPEESELATLLKASVEAGLEDKVYSLLHRLRTTARELSPSTVQTIEEWFTSEAAAAAGERERGKPVTKEDLEVAIEAGGGGWHGLGWIGKGNWKVERGNIDKKGVCKCCGEQLCTIDLDPQETENFSVSLAKLACEREAFSNEFKHFQGWLDKWGPFDAIVDGANVGLYQQNFAEGGFSFQQLNAVVRAVQRISQNGKSPLVLLHRNRTKGGAASSPRAQDLLQRWFRENTLYATPIGSNDDWYWLYAAVKFKCLLVTNDEMRDHLFQLLGNDFFPKWKERHQVRFSFNKATVELHMPPPYSIVIQESKDGSWHIPQSGGDDINTLREWLCVSRCLDVDLGDTSSESQLNLQTWASLPVETDSMENIVSHEQSEKLCGPPSELGKRQKRVSSRSTSPRKLRRELQAITGSLSPPASPTLLKLEAAEKHLNSPIDFQI